MASQGKPMAWVTLATTDAYALGALVLAHSLRQVGTVHQIVIMVTPGVSQQMRAQLAGPFDEVITVDVLDSRDEAHLALLARPELGITLTKLHCWSLTQYAKGVFLDADCLVMTNCDELFEREELSAAPDVGWPDCFNSGVFVFTPSAETFGALIHMAAETGSFDGGDQGLLNTFFSDWSTRDIKRHLSFLYNMTASAAYTYLPAFRRFGRDVKIVHFLGAQKPWSSPESADPGSPAGRFHCAWWDVYHSHVRPAGKQFVEKPADLPPQVFSAHASARSAPPPPTPASVSAHSVSWAGALADGGGDTAPSDQGPGEQVQHDAHAQPLCIAPAVTASSSAASSFVHVLSPSSEGDSSFVHLSSPESAPDSPPSPTGDASSAAPGPVPGNPGPPAERRSPSPPANPGSPEPPGNPGSPGNPGQPAEAAGNPGGGEQVAQAAADLSAQRRRRWEEGRVDFMGADRFDNVWRRISASLERPAAAAVTARPPEPHQPTHWAHVSAQSEEGAPVDSTTSELVSSLGQLQVSPPSASETTRRAAWDRGQMDYMGSDSFENILGKINETLSK